MKQAKEKVWLTPERKLVSDKDVPSGSILFAAKGQLVPDESLKGYEDTAEFFEDVTKAAAEPIHPGVRPDVFVAGQSNALGDKSETGPKAHIGPVKTLDGKETGKKNKKK